MPKVLVVGRGGREHALVRALVQSGAEVLATQPNPGMAQLARAVAVAPGDIAGIVAIAKAEAVDLVVVGPEAPLVAGLADALRAAGIATFGPGADGARLEGSKAFAKEFMVRHRIPTAHHRTCHTAAEAHAHLRSVGAPIVVKADGLAAGKGVVVAQTVAEAAAAIDAMMKDRQFGAAGATLVLEECLVGAEVSAMALCDGQRLLPLDLARDHKRLRDGDQGENTGGMGAVCPVPTVSAADLARIRAEVLEPTLAGLQWDGVEFRGVIYAGIMLTKDGPKVLEYNVRFGDPEAEVLLPRLGPALYDLLLAAAHGDLSQAALPPSQEAAVTVVLAAADYPLAPRTGDAITGIEAAEALAGVQVFHAGTALEGGVLRTAGGRVLSVTGLGPSVAEATATAYRGVACIAFDGAQFRSDIASSVR